MESADGMAPGLRAHLIDWVITKLLSYNLNCFFPVRFQFAWTSSFCNITDKDSVSWLKSPTLVFPVIVMFAFST